MILTFLIMVSIPHSNQVSVHSAALRHALMAYDEEKGREVLCEALRHNITLCGGKLPPPKKRGER